MQNKLHRTGRLAGVLTAAFALALTACSAGSTGSGPAPTKGTVTVGTLCLKSGDTVTPESCTVVEAMAAAANDQGGASGYRIEAIGCDVNRSDPTALPNCIRQLVHNDQVDVFVGNYQSAGIFAEIEPLKIASLANSFTTPEDFTSPMAFPLWGGSSTGMAVAARSLLGSGQNNPGAIVVNNAAGQASVKGLADFYSTAGISVDVIPASPAESDYTPFVSTARSNQNDPLVILQSAPQFASIARAAQSLGYKPSIIAPYTVFDANFLAQAGDNVEGTVVGNGYKPWTATPEGDELIATMEKYGDGHFNINLAAVQSYVGMKVLFQALQNLTVDEPGPADISGELAKGTYTNDFLAEPISWTNLSGNPPHLARVASMEVIVERIENGEFVITDQMDYRDAIGAAAGR